MDEDAWIDGLRVDCWMCGAYWHMSRDDKPAPLWRTLLMKLPMPKRCTGPRMYIVRHWPSETASLGAVGTELITRCRVCGRYARRRKPARDEVVRQIIAKYGGA